MPDDARLAIQTTGLRKAFGDTLAVDVDRFADLARVLGATVLVVAVFGQLSMRKDRQER